MPEKNEKHLESVDSVRWYSESVESVRCYSFVANVCYRLIIESLIVATFLAVGRGLHLSLIHI